jgi:hypothetical protein
MVGGVVLNHDGLLAAISPGQLFEEAEICAGVEGSVLPIIKARTLEFDGSESLHALPLFGNRNFRRATHAAPGGVQGRVLPEAGFIGEDQRSLPCLGCFRCNVRAAFWPAPMSRCNDRWLRLDRPGDHG